MTLFFKIISYVFHPLLMLTYILLSLMWMQPFLFTGSGTQAKEILAISVFSITFLMPGVAVLLMKFMNLIPSLDMPDKRNRIGPLIVTAIFHLWIYKNLLDNPEIPQILNTFFLGAIITLFVCFFINLFKKISLHTAGMGGWMTMIFISVFHLTPDHIMLLSSGPHSWAIHPLVFLSMVIFAAGLVGSGRLYLKAHSTDEIIGGYFIGISGQAIAFLFV